MERETEISPDGMSLYDAIDIIVAYKWMVLLISTLGLTIGIFLLFFSTPKHVSSIQITPLLDSSIPELKSHYVANLLIGLDSKDLYDLFRSNLRDRKLLAPIFEKSGLVDMSDLSDEEVIDQINGYINSNLNIEVIQSKKGEEIFLSVSLAGFNQALVEETLIQIINKSQDQLYTQLSDVMEEEIHSMSVMNDLDIQRALQKIDLLKLRHTSENNDKKIRIQKDIDELKRKHFARATDLVYRLELEIMLLEGKYQFAKSDRIDYLKEQSEIAGELGLDDLIEWETSYLSPAQIVKISDSSDPYFYFGTKVIDKEINQMENRLNDAPFIDGLRDLQTQLRKAKDTLENDAHIEGLRELEEQLESLDTQDIDSFVNGLRVEEMKLAAFKDDINLKLSKKTYTESPIVAGEIALVEYETSRIYSYTEGRSIVVLAAPLLAGILSSVAFVFFINGYRRHHSASGGAK